MMISYVLDDIDSVECDLYFYFFNFFIIFFKFFNRWSHIFI